MSGGRRRPQCESYGFRPISARHSNIHLPRYSGVGRIGRGVNGTKGALSGFMNKCWLRTLCLSDFAQTYGRDDGQLIGYSPCLNALSATAKSLFGTSTAVPFRFTLVVGAKRGGRMLILADIPRGRRPLFSAAHMRTFAVKRSARGVAVTHSSSAITVARYG